MHDPEELKCHYYAIAARFVHKGPLRGRGAGRLSRSRPYRAPAGARRFWLPLLAYFVTKKEVWSTARPKPLRGCYGRRVLRPQALCCE
jgi:hypothetical protein